MPRRHSCNGAEFSISRRAAIPTSAAAFVPVGCQHCDDPPCMHVCPSTATRRRADGIVTIDYDLCIGCAYCAVACPYQARFKIDAPGFAYGRSAMQNEIVREDPHRVGVAQKCTFCSDRIDFGLDNGLIPGVDPQATPACVNACIADALSFGDIEDPNSNVSRLLRTQKHFRMHAEIGTEPGFYYIYDKADGDEPTSPGALQVSSPTPAAGAIRTKGVEPWHQPSWDWKAAGNFLCGGTGIGLFTFAAVASLSRHAAAAACSARHFARRRRLVSGPAQDRPPVALRLRAAPAAALVDGAGGMAGADLFPACRARVLVRFASRCLLRPRSLACCSCCRKQ